MGQGVHIEGWHMIRARLPRRRFLQLAAGAAALPAMSRIASARAYPTRPVRVLVGFPPAGAVDISARLIAQSLSEQLGQPFIIENRPGAATNIATEVAVRAPADGYTLLLVSPPAAINATLYEKLDFNVIRDVAPVAAVIRSPFVLVTNPSVPAKTVPELIAYAKANPGKISMASSGIGSGLHLAGEMFKAMAGIDMIHVPYRGVAPALNDLIGGQVQVLFGTPLDSIEQIRAGKVRALAVTTTTRNAALPDVPTMSEFLPGYEASFWDGFGVVRNTPVEIVETLNREINAALADPRMKARFADLGAVALPGSPADFGKLISDETEKWGKVIRAANIKPES
jgi:tripartite-type tricarboxylate transporter receptor subunit TctC